VKLLSSQEAVDLINSSGWLSQRGTPLTMERLRVIRATGALGGRFPPPDQTTPSRGHTAPLWRPESIRGWLAGLRSPELLSTRSVVEAVCARTGVSQGRARRALMRLYDGPAAVEGRTYFWPSEAPDRVSEYVAHT
jgi:hypothetical protein